VTSPPVRILYGPAEIRAAVDRLAAEVSASYEDGVVLIAVLKGSVIFLADLVRRMTITPIVDFLAVSSYAEGAPRVQIMKDLDLDIAGRDVVLVEDVVDTGLSLTWLLEELHRREPRSLEVCAFVDKPARRLVPVDVRWIGLSVDEPYVCGYGLDVAERYRNLDLLAAADTSVLADDPDAYVDALYRSDRDGRGGAPASVPYD
jgi:hypoxanthine phosphoribosyltransferase